MASGTKSESTRTTPDQSLLEKVGPHATKIMVGAAVVGLISAFLPAVTMSISYLGSTASESLAVWRDWRGKLDILGYISVGAMAGLLLRKPNTPATKKLARACLITAGGALLMAVWLLLSIRGGSDLPKEFGGISIGVGCYLNILAALVLATAAALQAKRTNVF